jgi:serine protease Do
MRILTPGAAVAALVASVVCAGAADAAEVSRRNAVVGAVKKVRPCVVMVRAERRGAWSKKDVIGTGVIVDERGYVVTNRHVVAGAEKVVVVLSDGTEAVAQVHTEDAAHDLAILKLPSDKKYPELPFGPASDLMVGEDVVAVGNPFGFTNTVSTGIVSAVGREITMPTGETLKDLIQTNAGINPGNSGGPLLNIKGELIGVNVALRDGAQGIAFALNADAVQQLLSQHLSAGTIAHVRHGLVCHEAVLAEEGPWRQEVVVDEIAEKSPAEGAGLKRGDVVLRLAERAVHNRFDLERALWDCGAGDKVEARVRRDGKETTVTLKLVKGDAPERVAALPAAEVKYHSEDVATPAKSNK